MFSGKPSFNYLKKSVEYPQLSSEEQAYLDGPVNEICEMVNDWDVVNNRGLSDEVWAKFKEHRVFGLLIPKQYGGLEFSALGNSSIIAKFGSRSSTLAITAMVPNSLGPAELLMHYGTDAQKNYYLPNKQLKSMFN